MTYILLLLIFICFNIISYKKFKDIFSPSFIFSIAMTLGIVCSIIGLLFWNNITNIKIITIIILMVSYLSFFLGELFVRWLLKKKNKSNTDKYKKWSKKDIPIWITILEIIFAIITIILLYMEVKRIAQIAGYDNGSLGDMLSKFRSLSILNSTYIIEQGLDVNILVSQMRKVCETFAFINIFFLVKNIVNKKYKNINNIFYIFVIILTCILSILMSERMQIVIYIFAFGFMFIILSLKEMNLKEFAKKYFKKIISFLAITIAVFCLMLPIVGRKIDKNLVSYFSYYFGIEIPSLDIYMDGPINPPEYFGQETLRGMSNVAYKLKIFDKIEPLSTQWLEFKTKDGNIYRSNIFTSAKRYYHDFGWLGIIICQFIFSSTFTLIYLNIFKRKTPIVFVLYSSYIYMVADQIRDDLFYSNFIHINVILRLCILMAFFIVYNISTKEISIKEVLSQWKKIGRRIQ